jgi:NAD(P)-dependent dehydrogenase (short-subunit alcohol dehydrogenase family)
MSDLAGRTALVTGASAGLGRHFAWLLARHGATVVVAARRVPELAALVAEIDASGATAHALAFDVRNPDEAQQGMIKGAVLIPDEELVARIAELPKGKRIVTHCLTGIRAESDVLAMWRFWHRQPDGS